ncbi:hypothetical protein GF314_05030, partial [bacterium]|nr:hypothetical protein [bacterium]
MQHRPLAAPRARDLLGWPRVLAQVARHARNARAVARLHQQIPYDDLETIAIVRALADELRPLADQDEWPPVAEVSTAADLLEAPPPRRLEGGDLLAVAASITDLVRLRDWFLGREDALPVWSEAARAMAECSAVASELRRCLDADGQLTDHASPLLGRLRRTVREREQQVRDSVQRAMSEAERRGWTTGGEVTLRGDRYCLPLRSGDRRKVDGIVHDRSHTGQTVYVEPAATVHLANDLAESRLAMSAEETRILLDLNQRVDRVAADLLDQIELMLLCDRVRASMVWSDEVGGRRPEIAAGAAPRLCRARHPLLVEALAGAGRADEV